MDYHGQIRHQKEKNISINIIQCYAPTNDAEDEKKEEFYDQLQSVVNNQGDKDVSHYTDGRSERKAS